MNAYDSNSNSQQNDQLRISVTSLRVGDVLCVRSSGPLAELCCLIDGADQDHTMIVTGFDTDGVPIVIDVAFRGFRQIRLTDYENEPGDIMVRRHRVEGAGDFIVANALAYGAQHPTFALDRLGQIIVLSLARLMPKLSEFPPDSAARFLDRMHALFAASQHTAGRTDTAVCADIVFAGHDTLCVPSDLTSPYLGLVLPQRSVGGLWAWAQSAQSFGDFLIAGSQNESTRQHGPHPPTREASENSLIKLEWALYRDAGLSMPRNDECLDTEVSLRRRMLTSTEILARLLGITDAVVAPVPANVLAMYVLNALLDQRVIISARDIVETRSLRTIGYLTLDELRWARPFDPRPW
jgi:hypothetical protein